MRATKLLILLLIVFLFMDCQNKKSSTKLDVDNQAITYKVGDICKITNTVFTASTDSYYSKVQMYVKDATYNDVLDKMAKDGNFIRLMHESLNEYYKITEVQDTYVKINYTNILGKECNVRVNKEDIEHYKNPNHEMPVNYPINISKLKVDSLYKIPHKGTYGNIIGDFQLGMSEKSYNSLYHKYEDKGTIYQFAADETMAFTLKNKGDDLEAILFPIFKNSKLKSLRCELWDLNGGDGSYNAEMFLKKMFGEIYYRNGENYYWFSNGTKIALKVESCSQGREYSNANTSVVYFE